MKWKKDHKLPNTKNVRRKTNPAGITTTIPPKNQQSQNQNQEPTHMDSSSQQQQQHSQNTQHNASSQQQQQPQNTNNQHSIVTTGGPQPPSGTHQANQGYPSQPMSGSMMPPGITPISAPYPHGAMKPDYGLTTL